MDNSTQTGKGRGRPPLPESEQLSEIVLFRLTADEKARLVERAEIEGCSLTDVVRQALDRAGLI